MKQNLNTIKKFINRPNCRFSERAFMTEIAIAANITTLIYRAATIRNKIPESIKTFICQRFFEMNEILCHIYLLSIFEFFKLSVQLL